jgi:hypothetical protein
MGTHLHNTGEEVILRHFFEESVTKPSGINVGLYYDSDDSFVDGSDVGDISTEPGGPSYSRTPLSFGESSFTAESNTNQNWQVVFSDMTFDTSDSDQSVDAYFCTISFASEETNDGTTAQDHLLFTGSLDQSYDLTQIDSFTLSGAGLEID